MTSSVALVSACLLLGAAPAADSTLSIDAGKVVNRISPLMYGSCIEDVNHEIYGGLYAQMIFGESFEEPPKPARIADWTDYGGRWAARNDELSVLADSGAKLVRDQIVVGDGEVSCDVRLADAKGGNAGLILRVSEPKLGADAWVGYEVSISAKGQHVLLGRHERNFRSLAQAPAKIEAGRWHRLKVELKEDKVRVFLDGSETPAIDFEDPSPLGPGLVGVRTWNSDASYRNLIIERADGTKVSNVSFQNDPRDRASQGLSGMWDIVRTGDAVASLGWDESNPLHPAHAQRIERTRGTGTVGVANRGLNRWGLTFRQGHTYAGRLYLKQEGCEGELTVALQSADGSKTYASEKIGPIASEWNRHDFTLTSAATDANARFAVLIDAPGKVWVDQVYLSGTGDELFKGLPFRADIAEGLKREGLTALRYGGSMVNAPGYRWKSMIGDRDKRPTYKGTWYPYSTNGFGIEEFVQFCRAAGFEPIVAINIEETPQDAADLVEYLNGPVTTEWGKRRAANGHPEPYALKYIEIGNEEKTDAHYIDRFKLLYDAMRPRDPKVEYIVGAWWEPKNPISKRIVEELSGKAALWDLHVGGDNPRDGAKVDEMVRELRKLVPEWSPGSTLKACILEENGGRHDLARALGHAGIVNAAQRHGDFVLIDCPANCLQPWKQNDNAWDQGQLFFTSGQVWGMPPYYAQQMAASVHLPIRVESQATSPRDDLDLTATRDESGSTLVLKVVNAGEKSHRSEITVERFGSVDPRAEVVQLTGDSLTDRNLPDDPEKIHPARTTFDQAAERFTFEFPARSYTILKLRRR